MVGLVSISFDPFSWCQTGNAAKEKKERPQMAVDTSASACNMATERFLFHYNYGIFKLPCPRSMNSTEVNIATAYMPHVAKSKSRLQLHRNFNICFFFSILDCNFFLHPRTCATLANACAPLKIVF